MDINSVLPIVAKSAALSDLYFVRMMAACLKGRSTAEQMVANS
jgi:hypothetical protein